MEALGKDSAIRRNLPLVSIGLWLGVLYLCFLFLTEVLPWANKFLQEVNVKEPGSWSVTNISVIIFIAINGCLFFYLILILARTKSRESKASEFLKSLEQDNARVQEMLEGTNEMIESIEEERNKGREKVKKLVGEAQSMVDELTQKLSDKS